MGQSDLEHNNRVGKISMATVEAALKARSKTVNVPVTQVDFFSASSTVISCIYVSFVACQLDLPDSIQMTNGGTGPYYSSLILVTEGRGLLPPSLALVNPKSPHNVTVLLDNYYGRQFNSLNDIKIHRPSGNFFFTDVRCVL